MNLRGLYINIVEDSSARNHSIFSFDKMIECNPAELCLLLFDLIENPQRINLVQLNFRVDVIDLYTAYDIATAIETCKGQNIKFIGFSEELSLEHLLAICFCDFRICPPLAGTLSFSLNFKHFVFSNDKKYFNSIKIGNQKLPLATFEPDKLDELALAREKELGHTMLKKCEEIITRAITLNKKLNRTYSTAAELLPNNLLTHVCYEEFLSTNILLLKSVEWKYRRLNRIDLFSSWSRFRRSFINKFCILEINSNSFEELNSLRTLRKQLKILFNTTKVIGLLVIVNYKGGSYESADRIWCLLNALKTRFQVFTYIKVAASSGYCIASAGEKIFINPCGYLGNVGTVLVTPNYDNIFKQLGITVVNNIASNFEKNLPDSEIFKQKAEIAFTLFINRIAKSRKQTTDDVLKFMDGSNFDSTKSIENNFSDIEASFSSVLQYIKKQVSKKGIFIFIKDSESVTTKILKHIIPFSTITKILK